ncbi:MAG: hypothetical protein V1767_00925 [Chloroflexota bacterium]
MIRTKSRLGPNPYGAGGFTVTFGEADRVTSAIVTCDRGDIFGANDTQYGIRVSFATNVVTIVVVQATTVGAGPNAWAEVGAIALNARTFTVVANIE